MAGELVSYATLFGTAFAAASLLPVGSEPLLAALLLDGRLDPWLLWLTASLGNTTGAVLNWWLGRHALRWQDRRWFPVGRDQLRRAGERFRRYGLWSLLLACMPIVGDPLTLAAGLLRVPLLPFLLLVGVSKAGRYAALIWLLV